jgi:GDP-L-fucose synthase
MHLNIGTGEDLAIKELALLVAKLSGFRGEIFWDTSKPDGTPRKTLDVSRIKAIGFTPTVTLADGIASTIAWFKSASAKGEARN